MQQFMGPPMGPLPIQPMQAAMQQSLYSNAPIGSMGGFNPTIGQSGLARGGGLLARLFGRGFGQAAGSAAPMAQGFGQTANSAFSGLNLSSLLTNTQRVLGITQQVVPMIQQYGPLIRNMPTIWRIMRSSASTSTEQQTEASPVDDLTENNQDNFSSNLDEEENNVLNKESTIAIESEEFDEKQSQLQQTIVPEKSKTINGIPGPKLYV
ncbi:VrrA/YqfQ family protein [Halalkalibacter urbisdiaboli]|uniref:VrrA/YqfQ family protein n=1 Tax=Halalkalibacter urbisdiaboli TaxID=1960589 RepID=UPI000B437DED|nr:VrrA/YqfQ family protein [Halalkalibacter urbisdiaboli]